MTSEVEVPAAVLVAQLADDRLPQHLRTAKTMDEEHVGSGATCGHCKLDPIVFDRMAISSQFRTSR